MSKNEVGSRFNKEEYEELRRLVDGGKATVLQRIELLKLAQQLSVSEKNDLAKEAEDLVALRTPYIAQPNQPKLPEFDPSRRLRFVDNADVSSNARASLSSINFPNYTAVTAADKTQTAQYSLPVAAQYAVERAENLNAEPTYSFASPSYNSHEVVYDVASSQKALAFSNNLYNDDKNGDREYMYLGDNEYDEFLPPKVSQNIDLARGIFDDFARTYKAADEIGLMDYLFKDKKGEVKRQLRDSAVAFLKKRFGENEIKMDDSIKDALQDYVLEAIAKSNNQTDKLKSKRELKKVGAFLVALTQITFDNKQVLDDDFVEKISNFLQNKGREVLGISREDLVSLNKTFSAQRQNSHDSSESEYQLLSDFGSDNSNLYALPNEQDQDSDHYESLSLHQQPESLRGKGLGNEGEQEKGSLYSLGYGGKDALSAVVPSSEVVQPHGTNVVTGVAMKTAPRLPERKYNKQASFVQRAIAANHPGIRDSTIKR